MDLELIRPKIGIEGRGTTIPVVALHGNRPCRPQYPADMKADWSAIKRTLAPASEKENPHKRP
jgi:hypothetical protein